MGAKNLKNNDPNPKDAETSSSPQAVDQRLTAVENSIGELNNAIVGMLQAIELLTAEIGEVLMKQNKGKDIDYSSQELQENRGTRNQQPKKQKKPHLGIHKDQEPSRFQSRKVLLEARPGPFHPVMGTEIDSSEEDEAFPPLTDHHLRYLHPSSPYQEFHQFNQEPFQGHYNRNFYQERYQDPHNYLQARGNQYWR
ncbi:unnamed protein product [Citrullus colocynthis]|uniref:Uncharacterized protein n=1 Tax=Citrullus colocynthis TaxID=252529 RepID=A0ABP0XSE8_9ROSI